MCYAYKVYSLGRRSVNFSLVRAGPAKVLTQPLLGYAPLNFTYLDWIFWHGVLSCTNQQMESLPQFCFLFLVREIWPIQWSEKVQKWPQLVWTKKGAGFPLVSTYGSSTRLKIQIGTRKIERGIALLIMPLVLITTCLMYGNRFWVTSLDGWRTGYYCSATDIDRLLVSSGLSTPLFTLIGNNDFLELSHRF